MHLLNKGILKNRVHNLFEKAISSEPNYKYIKAKIMKNLMKIKSSESDED